MKHRTAKAHSHSESDIEQPQLLLIRSPSIAIKRVKHGYQRQRRRVQHLGRIQQDGWIGATTSAQIPSIIYLKKHTSHQATEPISQELTREQQEDRRPSIGRDVVVQPLNGEDFSPEGGVGGRAGHDDDERVFLYSIDRQYVHQYIVNAFTFLLNGNCIAYTEDQGISVRST